MKSLVRKACLWGLAAGVLVAAYARTSPPSEPKSAVAVPPAPPLTPAPSFDDAVRAAAEMPRLHSLLVSRRGKLLMEHYGKGIRPDRYANIKSASKSVISALVGIAIDRGYIPGVDQKIENYFPELRAGKDLAKRSITIENLLTMQSGLQTTSNRNYGAWVLSPNWVRYALSRPLVSAPGDRMEYSTGNTHLLSAILTKASGKSTWEFAQDALAKPLGFSLPQWPRDPQGVFFGGNDMLMTPRQMLKFGELYLNHGRAGAAQVVPARWIDDSFAAHVESPREMGRSYGYGWWIRELAGRRVHYAWGYGGQFIFVLPEMELVVVTTSTSDVAEERRSHLRTIFALVEDFVIPAAGSTD